jgi:hypothetical protein
MGAHRGEEEHNLLLVVLDSGAESHVFGHEDGQMADGIEMRRLKEVAAGKEDEGT